MTEHPEPAPDLHGDLAPLREKTIVLVGLMGVGKSSVGRRLAGVLDLPFRDADNEVEAAAGRSIPAIFAELGESAFRDGERRVISRLLDERVPAARPAICKVQEVPASQVLECKAMASAAASPV